MRRPRIAVAGAGYIGLAHLDAIARSERAALAAIVDPAQAAQRLGESWRIPVYPSLEALLSSEPPDAIVLATPNALHVEQDAYNKASNKAAYNADVARTQFRQQNSDERYAQERQQLIQLMSARDNQGRSLVSELMKGTYSAKAVEKALGAPGITRYLYNM